MEMNHSKSVKSSLEIFTLVLFDDGNNAFYVSNDLQCTKINKLLIGVFPDFGKIRIEFVCSD
jgi:hypothetical protein